MITGVETNGKSDHEARIARLEAARKEIEDTIVVMAHLESKAGARMKEHAELIAQHHALLASHAVFVAKHDIAMQEFDGKLNALIHIISRNQGGIESRP
jgi:hypothetical protein